jgi:hypothetical protein
MNKDQEFEAELKRRIAQMERGDANGIRRMTARDFWIVTLLAVLCLAGIIAGAFLT